jgi:hypothetical protein
MKFNSWLETRPSIGIVASLSGFTASLLAILQQISIILGLVGAIFGLLAGYYTWRVKREHWIRLSRALPLESAEEFKKTHDLAVIAATKAYDDTVKSLKS